MKISKNSTQTQSRLLLKDKRSSSSSMQLSQNSLQNPQLQKSYENKHPKKTDNRKSKRRQDLDKFKENCEKLKSKNQVVKC